ncbi:MAG: hypothetical protein ACD_52C00171G0003 [uncultured bacterium]|uniref:Activator of Hsp90 ATPase homologue 1/2-like C-terminal domain-containing protein n=1 Tax=Candidatus Woesebacteria bacterium RIFCSPHIGHO2_12_FULL_41_24 TaxID=1802510 RepID=A0A1F8AUS8_9BACT|nr:MAG: hypothetical protein ACD_52C00171G0003 [uncultured bacterium]OGM14816.1 MAG: hypothetical protein A2W15_00560 [Candidatus Woesebacteria bacterium RBG_16_41_13]OGM30308.1 MAG: hypothetical protein A2873_05265 [Candidatus Woesebacteria bacterium RIFCSPHIGHO2_01_FULL_42_80]OGM34347.1 MAG: hypothetical protein A3D84_04845 [Candidatus Woesebacteria bacterium RIFCSPHIGHO2_02_FULL_42_20]OGM55481.1 MAG: hypothetical protein A3E44_01000 [Candidatus Woesebacteria bacterium RIFCSPHIGHO2_12_FULL_41
MKIIKKVYKIKSSVEKVWDALTNPVTMDKWGANSAKMSDKQDFEFSLWNGDIWGKNTEVVSGKKLVQEWFAGKWSKPSIVTFTLSEKDGVTTLALVHTGVPEKEFDSINTGWDSFYLGEIKKLLEP